MAENALTCSFVCTLVILHCFQFLSAAVTNLLGMTDTVCFPLHLRMFHKNSSEQLQALQLHSVFPQDRALGHLTGLHSNFHARISYIQSVHNCWHSTLEDTGWA